MPTGPSWRHKDGSPILLTAFVLPTQFPFCHPWPVTIPTFSELESFARAAFALLYAAVQLTPRGSAFSAACSFQQLRFNNVLNFEGLFRLRSKMLFRRETVQEVKRLLNYGAMIRLLSTEYVAYLKKENIRTYLASRDHHCCSPTLPTLLVCQKRTE
jgi:hypothetical protein